MTAAAEHILARRRMMSLITLAVETTVETIPHRRYGPRPARHRVKTHSTRRAEIERAAVEAAKQRLGWRVYATHHPHLTLETVIRAYREQYLIERGFGRFKGRALAITPLFLQTETRVPGLIRLLSLALRVLILVEFVARRHLANTHSEVTGLYPGHPRRPYPGEHVQFGVAGADGQIAHPYMSILFSSKGKIPELIVGRGLGSFAHPEASSLPRRLGSRPPHSPLSSDGMPSVSPDLS